MNDENNCTVNVDAEALKGLATSVGMTHVDVISTVSAVYALYKRICSIVGTYNGSRALALAALIYICEVLTQANTKTHWRAWCTFLRNAVVGSTYGHGKILDKVGTGARTVWGVFKTGTAALRYAAEQVSATVEAVEVNQK